mmetsp:Transcript_75927/g.236359  ORF Transcript_75927/g.236359 Transcript_75927/m.236359 type:complete len:255 (-) Transcript_75927:102-866(-)
MAAAAAVLEVEDQQAAGSPPAAAVLEVESDRAPPGGLQVVVLSDTHGFTDGLEVPQGDILLHAGDFTQRGQEAEVRQFDAFLAGLPHRHKVVIAGNHDVGPFCDFAHQKAAELLPHCTHYLVDATVELEGLLVHGLPWRGDPRRVPPDLDLLLSHAPPQGHLDSGPTRPLGDSELLSAVVRSRPRCHVFGHVHEAAGAKREAWGGVPTLLVNCAVANDGMVARRVDKPARVLRFLPPAKPGTAGCAEPASRFEP